MNRVFTSNLYLLTFLSSWIPHSKILPNPLCLKTCKLQVNVTPGTYHWLNKNQTIKRICTHLHSIKHIPWLLCYSIIPC